MSGHSKWSTIKHKKEAKDAKRGKLFAKLLKEITIATKLGGSDLAGNARLRLAIQNAKGANLPKDNISRAIKRAKDKDIENYQEIIYEGYGPNGVGIFVECQTDNLNRTVAFVRNAFTKYGGSLGKNGSLEFIFDRKGIFHFEIQEDMNMEDLELELIDGGAEEIEHKYKEAIIIVDVNDFYTMQVKLEALNIEVQSATLDRIPKSIISLDEKNSKKVLNIVEKLEENDDVKNVYHNLDISKLS